MERFFQVSDARHVEHLLGSLDEDVRGTLLQLIQTEETPEAPVLSDEKLIERWNGLWDEWHSFPDWMGADSGDPCVLESAATLCMLAWQWLTAESPVAFISTLRGLQEDLSYVELSHEQFVEFFATLPEDVRKTIYAYLSADREDPAWRGLLQNVHSRWHEVYHALRATFDPDGYLMDCRALLSANWQYGIPALEDLMSKKEFAEAEQVASQTVMSFLRLREDQEWKSEASLLICQSMYPFDYGYSSEGITTVLKHWAVAAEQLKMAEKAAMMRIGN